MDNPNNYTSPNTPLDYSQTGVEKTNKSIWFIIFFVFSIFVIMFLLLFFYWDDLFKNKEIASLKTTIKCEDVDLEFELISCNVVLNNSKYETSIKFKKSSGEIELSKLFAFFSFEDGNIDFEEISDIDNLDIEQELTFSLINEPTNFYLLGTLFGVKDNCETLEFLCLTENNAPIANAGNNLTVNESSLVILNGSESYDPNGDLLTYTWIQVLGINVTLNNNNSVIANFTAQEVDSQETLIFKLIVSDGNFSDGDIVEIKVNDITIEEEVVYDISAPPPLPS